MNPYRHLSLQELQERGQKADALSFEERSQRQHLAYVPTLRHGRWRKHFDFAWTTLISTSPHAPAKELADRAKVLADAAFAITEPLHKDAALLAERVYYDGEEP